MRTIEITIDDETFDHVAKWAERQGKSVNEVLRDVLAEQIAREAWLAEAVEKGRADVRAGRLIPHEEVMAMFMDNEDEDSIPPSTA